MSCSDSGSSFFFSVHVGKWSPFWIWSRHDGPSASRPLSLSLSLFFPLIWVWAFRRKSCPFPHLPNQIYTFFLLLLLHSFFLFPSYQKQVWFVFITISQQLDWSISMPNLVIELIGFLNSKPNYFRIQHPRCWTWGSWESGTYHFLWPFYYREVAFHAWKLIIHTNLL